MLDSIYVPHEIRDKVKHATTLDELVTLCYDLGYEPVLKFEPVVHVCGAADC